MVGMSQHGRCQWALKLVSLLCLQALLLVVSVLLPSGRMQTRVSAFQVSPLTLQRSTVGIYSQRQRQGQHYPLQLHVHKTGSNDAGDILLVSSFSQGVVTKPDVQQQLRQSLLQRVDDSNRLRLVYIPTAMYALRRESNNTPGKQRQRARADAKKRRDRLVQILSELLPNCQVLAVTLDFADGSIKHPGGSNDANDFPKSGQSCLSDWDPSCLFVEGGNTFWLQETIEKGQWQPFLLDAICNGGALYCGSSAGAIIAGRSVETACWKGWDDPSICETKTTYEDWSGVSGLDLLGGASVFPHMSSEYQGLVNTKRLDLPNGTDNDRLMCLTDDEAVWLSLDKADSVNTKTKATKTMIDSAKL